MKNTKIRRAALAVTLVMLTALTLSGCKPSKKSVEKSSWYKELKKENKSLKKKLDSYENRIEKEDNMSEDDRRARDYLDKIARDRVNKLEIGYADNMEGGEFLTDNQAAFCMSTAIADRADLCSLYTPEEIEEMYGPGYEYILYDENNAVYEIMVYEGDYVVFTDLPDRVYYSYDASALGEAMLHFKNGYPDSNLLHRLADTPFITDKDDNYYDNRTARQVANQIDRMDKEKTSRKDAVRYWGKSKKGTSYQFFHHGNKMKITVYDEFISIRNMDDKITWYKASAEDIDTIKSFFADSKNPGKTTKKAKEEDSDSEKNHYEDMNTESSEEDS